MTSTEGLWETPSGQSLAESNGEIVNIDAQGFPPKLPDSHFTAFPILGFSSSTTEITQGRTAVTTSASASSKFILIESFVHRLLGFSSVSVDLFIPPFSTPSRPVQERLQLARVGRISLHPELPILALAHAHHGGYIFLFDLRTNSYLKYKLILNNHHQLNSLAFSKYNLLAAGMSTGEILLFQLNLSINASAGTKPLRLAAIPSFASLLPPQFPPFPLLGEVTDLNFDYASGRYLAVATTRSGTWIYDTVCSSCVRLSKHPSAAVAFCPSENILAVSRERTGDIEFFTVIRAGTLTFSLPTIAKSGFKSTVTKLHWTPDGKMLLYCNDGQEGIRILKVQSRPTLPPEAKYVGNVLTPLRSTRMDGVPYGGVPAGFALDKTGKRLVVSYSKSPLLEAFALSQVADSVDASSVGVIRGPPGKSIGDKIRGKLPEGQSPFEEDSWERAVCVDMGFVGQALGDKGSLFAGAWNGGDGGKVAFVAFYMDDINALRS